MKMGICRSILFGLANGGGVMPRPFLLHGNSRKVFHGFRWIEYLEIEKLSKRVDNITSVTVFIICH